MKSRWVAKILCSDARSTAHLIVKMLNQVVSVILYLHSVDPFA